MADSILDDPTVGDISPFLDLVWPADEATEGEDLTGRFAGQLQEVFSIEPDTARSICHSVQVLGRQPRIRDLLEALVPLGPHPGWLSFDEPGTYRLLRCLCDIGLESRIALEKGVPPMPLFAMPKSGSSYSAAVMAEMMGVRPGVVSLWHVRAYLPWTRYIAHFPMPNHDHMSAHFLNLQELAASGISRVAIQLRDPRQFIVSQLRHMGEFGGNVSQASIEQVSRDCAEWIAGWRVIAPAHGISVHFIRFEDMTAQSDRFFQSILDFFGAPAFMYDNLATALQRAEAERSQGGLNFRVGRSDEWRDVLNAEQVATIEAACAPAFAGLYEFPGGATFSADRSDAAFRSSTTVPGNGRASGIGPAETAFYSNLAQELGIKLRPSEAIIILRWLVAQGSHDALLRAQLGELLLDSGDLEGAEAAVRSAFAIDPSLPQVSAARAAVLEARGHGGEALEALHRVAAQTDDPDLHARLGQLLLRQGQADRAAAALRKAAELGSGIADHQLALAELLGTQRRHEEAAAIASNLLAAHPNDQRVCTRVAELLVRMGDLAGAEEAYRRARAIEPMSARLGIGLAGILELTDRCAEAIEILQPLAAAGTRDPGLYARLGQLSVRQGELDRAEGAYRRAIELDPTSVDYRRTLADVLDATGRSREGAEILQKMAAERPDDAELQARLGQVLIRGDDLAGAEAALRRAIALDPGPVSVQTNLSDVLAATGRPFEAAQILRQLVARGIRDAQVYASLAQQLRRCGDLDAAEHARRTAIELGADDPLL